MLTSVLHCLYRILKISELGLKQLMLNMVSFTENMPGTCFDEPITKLYLAGYEVDCYVLKQVLGFFFFLHCDRFF